VADREGDIAGPRHYGDIFTMHSAISISVQRLKRWLARKKKNTAPGISGMRVDHLRGGTNEGTARGESFLIKLTRFAC
jgi:hypothetical protein